MGEKFENFQSFPTLFFLFGLSNLDFPFGLWTFDFLRTKFLGLVNFKL